MIFLRIKVELMLMIRKFYTGMFIKTAQGSWLDNKAEDYSKYRKQARKTEGILTVTKLDKMEELIVPKNFVFKTTVSTVGKEYRFLSKEKTVIEAGKEVGEIPIIAENEGVFYNVPTFSITQSLVHLENVKSYENLENWIKREGADLEEDESLRERTLNAWAELSTNPTAKKYKSVAESVDGVLHALVDDMHPRGQGTIDVIVSSQNGVASEELLKEVDLALEKIKGVYDNVLVKSAEVHKVSIDLVLYIELNTSEEGLQQKVIEYARDYFSIKNRKKLNVLYLSELIFYIRKNTEELEGVKILEPTADLILEKNKIIVLENVTVTVERG